MTATILQFPAPAPESDAFFDACEAAQRNLVVFAAMHDQLTEEQALRVLAGEALCRYAQLAGAADARGLAECFIGLAEIERA